MAKPNRWVDFIRKWAKDNDTSYSCALSNPKCKDAYRAKYGVRRPVPARTERERMGLEDVNIKPLPKKKAFKKQVEEYLATLKAKPDVPKKTKLRLKVVDIVKKRFDDAVYYSNRFADYPEAYGIVDGKVMIIGEILEDYDQGFYRFDEPIPVDFRVRFYNADVPRKAIKLLNDLQDLQEGKPIQVEFPRTWIFKATKDNYGSTDVERQYRLFPSSPDDRKIPQEGLYKNDQAEDFTVGDFKKAIDKNKKPETSPLLRIAKFLQRNELGKITFFKGEAPKVTGGGSFYRL